uniref:TLC domain-containing protein 1-like protein n=1 Tax=Callorhinchus milii TaxID=7868 RepID=V9L9D8_CALMI
MISLDYPIPYVLFSAASFGAARMVMRTFSPLPGPVQRDEVKSWRWTNLNVSVMHSLITGPWALLCVYLSPELLTEIQTAYNSLSHMLVCTSTGYFVQDVADIILSGQSRASWEFLVHHLVVISTFLYTVLTNRYIAGAVVALFVEINSIFLHTRLLLKLMNAQTSQLYHWNKYINAFTYVVFRLSAQLYLTWYVMRNMSTLPHSGYFSLALNLMNIMISIYFYRLIRTDFFRKPKHHLYNGSNLKFVDE